MIRPSSSGVFIAIHRLPGQPPPRVISAEPPRRPWSEDARTSFAVITLACLVMLGWLAPRCPSDSVNDRAGARVSPAP